MARGIDRFGSLISSPIAGASSRPANAKVIVAKNVKVEIVFRSGVIDCAVNSVWLPWLAHAHIPVTIV